VTDLRYTLLCDGSSDQALLPLINWSLREQGLRSPVYPEWANLGVLRHPPGALSGKIRAALDLYPCELLFVHRDCEAQTIADRRREIGDALEVVFGASHNRVITVCVVPRRMTEAWLLISERAIRIASGNPNGQTPLLIPAHNVLEELPNPKETLFALLRSASELHGRRLRSLRVHRLIHRVIELIDDFSPLRTLPAFAAFEEQLGNSLGELRERGFRDG
jgi:hypothetical protein